MTTRRPTSPTSKGRNGRPWRRLRQHLIDQARATDQPCPICHGTHGPIAYHLSGRHPLGPVIDHINELDEGGHPTDPTNLQVTHHRCNQDKENTRRRTGKLKTTRRW